MKILMISADEFEDLELFVPYYRFREADFEVVLASTKEGRIKGKHGYEIEVNKIIDQINPVDFDVLFLPGGKAPAEVRKSRAALEIAKHFFNENKPVLAICHGPQILVSAGLLKGRHAAAYKTVGPEVKDAGGIYEDREVVVDGNLVTSRQPEDLSAFLRESMNLIGSLAATM